MSFKEVIRSFTEAFYMFLEPSENLMKILFMLVLAFRTFRAFFYPLYLHAILHHEDSVTSITIYIL